MAREIHEREDLLRDAVALVPRALFRLKLGDRRVELFAGFRGDSLSLYLDDDPVYHFNDRGELRRAYTEGRIIKAERRRLVALVRMNRERETILERQPGGKEVDRRTLAQLAQTLGELLAELTAGRFEMVGQIPADGDATIRLQTWLEQYSTPTIAISPRV